jgi:O-methyltransferase
VRDRRPSLGVHARDYPAGSSATERCIEIDVNRARHTISQLRARVRSRADPAALRSAPDTPPNGFEPWERTIVDEARPHTMTSLERMVATIDAVAHVVRRGVPGALVECGVWRGGSVLAMIRTLQHEGVADRDIYLFDTFEGMTRPTEVDTSRYDPPALEHWTESERQGAVPWHGFFNPDVFTIDSVRSLILGTGYPETKIHFVEGRVEDTLPEAGPPSIALLRLDTDWYDSTWHELTHLYPRLSDGGLLIIDDYGHWDGCRAAVDRYFSEVEAAIFLSRIDYTGRVGVKSSSVSGAENTNEADRQAPQRRLPQ